MVGSLTCCKHDVNQTNIFLMSITMKNTTLSLLCKTNNKVLRKILQKCLPQPDDGDGSLCNEMAFKLCFLRLMVDFKKLNYIILYIISENRACGRFSTSEKFFKCRILIVRRSNKVVGRNI